jgi:nucleoside-diphosphate-sugar epimerase
MSRILITGGNGFLGSNLARFFLKKGDHVGIISRSCSNIADILESITFIRHNSPGYSQFAEQIRSFNPTIVIHCAWDGGSTYMDVNNVKQFKNIGYGVELLECINSAMFIGVGSFSEYGNISTPVSESTQEGPITLYGQSKSSFKSISKMICLQKDIRWVWIRPCLIYGPKDVPTRLFPSTVHKLIAGENVVLDSCKDIVDYLHVDDFSIAVYTVIESYVSGVVNVCSGNEYCVRSLIERICGEVGGCTNVTFDNTRDRHYLSSYVVGNPEVLRSLGWSPTIDINTGLKNIIIEQKAKQVIMSDLDGLHSDL